MCVCLLLWVLRRCLRWVCSDKRCPGDLGMCASASLFDNPLCWSLSSLSFLPYHYLCLFLSLTAQFLSIFSSIFSTSLHTIYNLFFYSFLISPIFSPFILQSISQRFLTKREQQLVQRRRHAEELLKWKQRLDQEEAEVRRMEKEALAVWDRQTSRDKDLDVSETQKKESSDISSSLSHHRSSEPRTDSEKGEAAG